MKRRLDTFLLIIGLVACETPQQDKVSVKDTLAIKATLIVNDTLTSRDTILNSTDKTDICASRQDTIIPDEISQYIKQEFAQYRLAKNSDFFDNYWCYFHEGNESPYFTTGDFDGDNTTEYALILTTNDRLNTVVIVVDKTNGKFNSAILENIINEHANVNSKYSKFGFGLKNRPPDNISSIATDSTYQIKTEIIAIEYFEKSGLYYYWEDSKYKKIHVGC